MRGFRKFFKEVIWPCPIPYHTSRTSTTLSPHWIKAYSQPVRSTIGFTPLPGSQVSGRVWVLKISSVDVYSINLVFDRMYIPKEGHLHIYNLENTVIQGPITRDDNTSNGHFATDLIPGSEIVLEYFEPILAKENGVISISEVIHGYINLFSDPSKSFGNSAPCNFDINCPEGNAWQSESSSVAMIIVGNNRICSAALVNNAC